MKRIQLEGTPAEIAEIERLQASFGCSTLRELMMRRGVEALQWLEARCLEGRSVQSPYPPGGRVVATELVLVGMEDIRSRGKRQRAAA